MGVFLFNKVVENYVDKDRNNFLIIHNSKGSIHNLRKTNSF